MMDKLGNADQISTKGSILTLIQSLHNIEISGTINHNDNSALCSENKLNQYLLRDLHMYKADSLSSSEFGDTTKKDEGNNAMNTRRSILNGSHLSLPESINSNASLSLHKEEIHYSSQNFRDMNHNVIMFDYPKQTSLNITDHIDPIDADSQSIPSENDVFTDTEQEVHFHVSDITHFSTSSSGYISTSPVHEHSFYKHDDYEDSLDHGYITHFKEDCERDLISDSIIISTEL